MAVSQFKQKVISVVNSIPNGKVVSYGQVALMVGVPRGARQVGQVLSGLDVNSGVPWWRVVNNAGRISIKGSKYATPQLQKKLLMQEGVVVSKELTLDIEYYRFRPTPAMLAKTELDDEYIEMLVSKYLV